MSRLRNNVLANLMGQGGVALLSLLVVPWYIKHMGVESYALVGVYASLQAMLSVLDMGLSQTLGREVAVHSSRPSEAGGLLDISRTLEVIYALGAGLVFLVVTGASGYLAQDWLKPVDLPAATVAQALWIIGLVVALRWPLTLYTGGLYGLQRQFLLNVLLLGFTLLQTLGAVGVLILISPTVEAFFIWQAAVSTAQVLVTRWMFWRCLPPGSARFSLPAIRHTWKFAAGMTAISVLSTALTQLDKFVLSRLVDLKAFGYYVLASTAAAVLYKLSFPIFNAFLPKMTQLHSLGDEEGLCRTYRLGCQLLALVIMPSTLILAMYAEPVLAIWTGNPDLVRNASLIFALLVIGNGLNSLMVMPYALQLAHGWTRLSIIQSSLSVLIFVPLIYGGIHLLGAVGAATAWLVLNIVCLLGGLWAMHRRLLPSEQARWYRDSLFMPLFGGALALVVAQIFPVPGSGWDAWPLPLAGLLAVLAVAIALPFIRDRLFGRQL